MGEGVGVNVQNASVDCPGSALYSGLDNGEPLRGQTLLDTTMGMLFYLVLRTSNISQPSTGK